MQFPSDDQLFRHPPRPSDTSAYRRSMFLLSGYRLKDDTLAHAEFKPEQLSELPCPSLAYTYESTLTELARSFNSISGTYRDSREVVNEWQQRIHDRLNEAIEKHLEESGGSIVLFPSSLRRAVCVGTLGQTSFELTFDPFDPKSSLPGDLMGYVQGLRPITVNPHEKKTKKNLRIFLLGAVLAAIFYGIFVATGMSAEMTVPFSIFLIIAACGALGLLRHGPKYLKWLSTKGRDPVHDAMLREYFQEDALKLHKTIRFYRLWAAAEGVPAPAAIDRWEQMLYKAVEEFSHLSKKY